MEYEYNVQLSALKKLMLRERCNDKTNCGEILFLALIHMELIDYELWNTTIIHHLKLMCNITELNNNYKYNPIANIVKNPIDFEQKKIE